MKVIFLILTLLVLSISLFSNPIMPMLMSEVWFADNGHFMVEFYPDGIVYFDVQVYLSNGEESLPILYDFTTAPYDSVIVIDVSEMMPDLAFNPLEDELLLQFQSGTSLYSIEGLSWGNSFSNTINPPLSGQSLVQFWDFHPLSMDYHYTWYKDEPPTPNLAVQWGLTMNARDTLCITITDQNNNPVINLPIYWRDNELPYGYTNSSGVFADTVLAGRWQILLKNPLNSNIVFNQSYWLEPNECTDINIQISITGNSGETTPAVVPKGLKAYPSPFNQQTADAITFKYEGETKLSRDTYIRLYDTKGRFIQQIQMSNKGTTTWKPSAEIGSGHYFARLISGNRILDTTTISIIK